MHQAAKNGLCTGLHPAADTAEPEAPRAPRERPAREERKPRREEGEKNQERREKRENRREDRRPKAEAPAQAPVETKADEVEKPAVPQQSAKPAANSWKAALEKAMKEAGSAGN